MNYRCYLDYNATTPINGNARKAMIEAMDLFGNPSSVHLEGRKSRSLLEKSRSQILAALDAEEYDIIFTSSATEAAALGLAKANLKCAGIEHEAVSSWCDVSLKTYPCGRVKVTNPREVALQLANSETGVLQSPPDKVKFCDVTQAFGKIPLHLDEIKPDMAIVSSHKIGGPKGVGALIVRKGIEIEPQIRGGGQEKGRRSGTENIIGIAGFGAAAETAIIEQKDGKWERTRELRDFMECFIKDADHSLIFAGRESDRLPNTSCLVTSGWRGEMQVIQMDLAGFAVSAGSACSSGKIKSSTTLKNMGFDDASCNEAIRISLSPYTQREEIQKFSETWLRKRKKCQC